MPMKASSQQFFSPSGAQALNNHLQYHFATKRLTWEKIQNPHNTGPWEVTAFFDGIEYGRAVDRTVGAASEEAARQALAALRSSQGV
ncbi:hypothetical protein FIBSPDRAFT_1039296 [Athelia psychrophila]|uniref:DRBM domain-containing protein n=1 Tax=Athelia psychrophila TaxID=1759441 RepID=A0A166S2U3_9AGAM|nr:hypothetical protein FIBSPDRAFT_1039296 [Fibularhizoctonia sp. CBS 109695]